MTSNNLKCQKVQGILRFYMILILFSFGYFAYGGSNAEIARNAAKGNAEALKQFRQLSLDDVMPILKQLINKKNEIEKKFATQELLRIGTDEAMTVLVGNQGVFGSSGNNNTPTTPPKIRNHNKLPTLEDILKKVEAKISSLENTASVKSVAPHKERFKSIKNRLIKSEYKAGRSDNSELHVISIYKALLPEGISKVSGMRVPGHATINVTYTERPISLLLFSHDPVVWTLKLSEGVKIENVYVSGYHEQELVGLPEGAKATISTFRKKDKNKKPLMDLGFIRNSKTERRVLTYTGMPVTTFQGAENGREWEIGPGLLWWREQHVLADAQSLLRDLSGGKKVSPSKVDLILSALDNEDGRKENISRLLALKTKESREALITWGKESIKDVDNGAFIDSFEALKKMQDPRASKILIEAISGYEGSDHLMSQVVVSSALEALVNMGLTGKHNDPVQYLIKRAKSNISMAKFDEQKALEDLNRVNLLRHIKPHDISLIFDEASKSDVNAVRTAAEKIKSQW